MHLNHQIATVTGDALKAFKELAIENSDIKGLPEKNSSGVVNSSNHRHLTLPKAEKPVHRESVLRSSTQTSQRAHISNPL
jgi:hypothetical protein